MHFIICQRTRDDIHIEVTAPPPRQPCSPRSHVCSTASLALEVAQHKAVASLAAQFASLTSEALGKKWYTHFEAWLFARRGDAASVAGGGRACMLPADTGPAAIAADHELQRKLLAAGVSQNITSDIVTELGRLPERLSHKVRPAHDACFAASLVSALELIWTECGEVLSVSTLCYPPLHALPVPAL